MDDALDDRLVFRVEFAVAQQLGDDGEAAGFNIHRFDLFNHKAEAPFPCGGFNKNSMHRAAVCQPEFLAHKTPRKDKNFPLLPPAKLIK